MAAVLKAARIVALAVPAFLAGAAPVVHAHAMLDHAVPAVGATVATAPKSVELTFTEDVEPAFSTIEIAGPGGAKVEAKAVEHPQSAVLVLPLPALAPGEYSVHWKVVSVDTHATEGSFRFRVRAP